MFQNALFGIKFRQNI